MDISGFKIASSSRPCRIKHPETGEDTDIVFNCLSPEAPEVRQRVIELNRDIIKRSEDETDLKKIEERVRNQFEERRIQNLAVLIESWSSLSIGESVEYSPENAIMVLTDFPWIYEQIDQFTGRRANFFAKSGTA